MKDSLKDFTEKNREGFDHREPPDSTWSSIERSLTNRKGLWDSVVMWRVAAIVFFGLSAFLFLTKDRVTPSKNELAISARESARIDREFSDVESFYRSEIAEKVAFIEDFDESNENARFTQDIQKLDAMYHVLREELKIQPSEKVKDAIILNMLIRIDLLNQQIKQLEDARRKEKKPLSSI